MAWILLSSQYNQIRKGGKDLRNLVWRKGGEAKGLIGKGALTVEEVRLLKGAGILTP